MPKLIWEIRSFELQDGDDEDKFIKKKIKDNWKLQDAYMIEGIKRLVFERTFENDK